MPVRKEARLPNPTNAISRRVLLLNVVVSMLNYSPLHVTSTIIMQANSPYCVHLSNPLGAVVGRVYVVDGDDIGYRQKCCEKL